MPRRASRLAATCVHAMKYGRLQPSTTCTQGSPCGESAFRQKVPTVRWAFTPSKAFAVSVAIGFRPRETNTTSPCVTRYCSGESTCSLAIVSSFSRFSFGDILHLNHSRITCRANRVDVEPRKAEMPAMGNCIRWIGKSNLRFPFPLSGQIANTPCPAASMNSCPALRNGTFA